MTEANIYVFNIIENFSTAIQAGSPTSETPSLSS
jgi:hypothetical protein